MGSTVRKGVGLLMLKNRVSRLGIIHIWVVPSYKVFDLLFFRNSVLKLRNVQYAELQGVLFADCQEWSFQAAKPLEMRSTILQEGRFADAQEERIQAAKSSEMGSAVPQRSRFADSQESRFQAANPSNMGNVVLQGC